MSNNPACKGSGVKVRVLCIDDRVLEFRPVQPRPRVMFKGSDVAYDRWRSQMRQTPPKGHRFVVQETQPDEQGFRTSFIDLTARAAFFKAA